MTMAGPVVRRRTFTPRATLLGLVLVGVLFTSIYPIRRYFSVQEQIAALRGEDARLDAKAAQLREEKAGLQNPSEIERIARERLGYVRPGETAFIVVDPPKPPQTKLNRSIDKPAPADPGGSVWSRWWSVLRRAVSARR